MNGAEKPITIENREDGTYRLTTKGWHRDQDKTGSAEEMLDFLLAVCSNGHKSCSVLVWSDQR